MEIDNLIPVIQTAISPMILISGVGLLLISMSNRLGRVIDRTRKLDALKRAGDLNVVAQIKIIWTRAKLLRFAMTLSAISILLAAVNIILLFVSSLFEIRINSLIISLFITGMLCVIGAMILYVLEINQSIKALALDLED